ncbi:type I polyketide synthase [Streptomyces sp. NRRL S-350]|uniref:type I polyketide synthase n=1 Tax=Streptomyces sp. NRRL S-350 TaxID=1463902 RepID=UPI00055E3495|nr:type I polyketide synthase [Streptomyces sp. NRRL S-350]
MSASNAEPIAVIGMGCRFPGGVETPGGLWRLAADGRGTAGPVPPSRWDAGRLAAQHDPALRDRAAVGCFLEGDVWAWEPEALAVAPAERAWVDPQSRVMMEVARESVEHAGLPLDRVRGSRTGVYVGTYAPDNLFRAARPVEDAPNSPFLFGNFPAATAGRVAFSMDLRGPVMVISTHCSSGMVALDTACGALSLRECDLALAGGVLLMLSPLTHLMEAPLLLSPSGACRAFDGRADGYVRGEGAAAVVLKRLADARRDGDRVLAVIRASAVNNDGQATRLTAPSSEMQQELFRTAVSLAGVDPGEVGLVEAHGPGTSVGDPVEYSSIQAVYGRDGRGRCALGSVKTNIGHTEPVSGLAGLVKAVECLRRGTIPPNRDFTGWNPSIDREQRSRLFVPTELTRWPVPGRGRLAAVCSYGVSGTNGHVLLEAPPAPRRRPAATAAAGPAPGKSLFLLSAASRPALLGSARRLADWAEAEGASVPAGHIAHTLALRRRHAEFRLGIVADGARQLARRARRFADGSDAPGVVSGSPVLPPGHRGPVFVFTGQGSQYPGMCRGLLTGEPAFAAAIDGLEPLVRAESGLSLRELILHPEQLKGVDRIQPVLFGVQVALAALWRSWGVEPAAVIGQSLGEVAAAVVAGALTPRDGVQVICRRSRILAGIAHGAMASVMLGAADTRAAIEAAGADRVDIGVVTAPSTTVVSGDAEQVLALVAGWQASGIVARLVDVDVASHSYQVDPVVDELRNALAEVAGTPPTAVRLYSTVSDEPRDPGPLDASYWVRNQRDTVQFLRAVRAALADGHRLFVECTAHPLATRPIIEASTEAGIGDVVAVGSLRRDAPDDGEAFLTHLASVHAAGFDGIDYATRYGDGRLADVPTTCWNRSRHGDPTTPYTLVAPGLPAAAQHPLLGTHVHDPEQPGRHLWQAPISPARLPWLGDHRVAGTPVLPGTGFAEMLLAAGCEVLGSDRIVLKGLRIETPLVLDPEPEVVTRLTEQDGVLSGQVLTRSSDGVVVHARATLHPAPDSSAADASAADAGGESGAENGAQSGARSGAQSGAESADDSAHDAAAESGAGREGGHPHAPGAEDRSPSPQAAGPTDEWTDLTPDELHRHFRDRHQVFHGPAFTAIDRIRLHPEHARAVAALRTADSARVSAAALRLHPALADEFVQTAVAAWLAHCATSPGPVVVAGFEAVRLHGPTGQARFADVTLAHADDLGCTASGTLTDADGTVVATITGLRLANITPREQRYADRLAHLAWQPGPAPALPTATGRQWLVLSPERAHWASRLAAMLGERAGGCRLLRQPAGAPPDPAVLTHALDEASEPVTDVLLVLSTPDTDPTPEAALRAVRQTLAALRSLAARTAPPRLWVAWRGDQPLACAGLRGLLRVAAFEVPELRASSLQFSNDTPLDHVLADLLADTPVVEVRWHRHQRTVARIRTGPDPTAPARAERQVVRTDGSYLVTGGLGGLGLLTARRFAERGARGLVLVGRSAPDAATRRELDALRAAGDTVIETLRGDAAEPETIRRAVELANKAGRLRGVVHAAGVVEDAVLDRIDDPLLDRVWRGKAEGAWALHRHLSDVDLDFFAVYSSVAALLGSPGQGAYAAANAYLDALVAHRRAQGLPATGIHWGAWSQVGRGQHLARRGFVMISPQDGMDALERILAEGHHQVAYSPIDPARWTASYPAVRSSALLADLLAGAGADAADEPDASPVLDELRSAATSSGRHRILTDLVVRQVHELLGTTGRHIGPHTSLVLLGLDSLGAVQLQQRLTRALHTTIAPGVIWTKPTAASLADWLLDAMALDDAPSGATTR